MIIDIEQKESDIEDLIFELRGINSIDTDSQMLLEKYVFMQRRVIEIDRLTMRNIIFVEKIQVPRLRSSLLRVKDTNILIEMLKKESIDLAEDEEGICQRFSGEEEKKEQAAKLQELQSEKTQQETDLKTFSDQQEAIKKREKCLEEEKDRLTEQKRMVNIWSKVADKTKLLGLLEQELEVLQLQKLNLESTVIYVNYPYLGNYWNSIQN